MVEVFLFCMKNYGGLIRKGEMTYMRIKTISSNEDTRRIGTAFGVLRRNEKKMREVENWILEYAQ